MNKRVAARMFTLPIMVYKKGGTDSSGDATDTSTITVYGYRMEEKTMVINSEGKQEVSGTQIYLLGTDVLKLSEKDELSFDGQKRIRILTITTLRKPGDIPDLGIVYIP